MMALTPLSQEEKEFFKSNIFKAIDGATSKVIKYFLPITDLGIALNSSSLKLRLVRNQQNGSRG